MNAQELKAITEAAIAAQNSKTAQQRMEEIQALMLEAAQLGRTGVIIDGELPWEIRYELQEMGYTTGSGYSNTPSYIYSSIEWKNKR